MNIPVFRFRNRFPIFIAIVSFIYFGWQLVGLRFENHDDIYFHLYANIYGGDYFAFAKKVAYEQARIQAFINMPLTLWVNSFQRSYFFDVINIGFFAALYISLIYYLAALVGRSNSLLMVAALLFVFPLHYYFSFPQGYAVVASYNFVLVLLSGGLLGAVLDKPSRMKLIGSLLLFVFSLFGPEYNLLLHPILIFLVYVTKQSAQRLPIDGRRKLGAYYFAGWLLTILVYLVFSKISRAAGGDSYGRVAFSFSVEQWAKTFFILQEKAFLPFGLVKGVGVWIAEMADSSLPRAFTYQNIWTAFGSWEVALVSVCIFFIIFVAIFYHQTIAFRSASTIAIVFAAFAIIPMMTVASSSHYQQIVLNGWLRGHLATFYSNVGLWGLALIGSFLLLNSAGAKCRLVLTTMIACLFGVSSAVTLAYNNVTKRVILSNSQKWEAAELLASYISTEAPKYSLQTIYAPAFWATNGVSAIPGVDPTSSKNYWTLYTSAVLHKPILIANQIPAGGVVTLSALYSPTHIGVPVVLFEERNVGGVTRKALASSPVEGVFLEIATGSEVQRLRASDWKCKTFCEFDFSDGYRLASLSIAFKEENSK
nr:hypothetical protein [Herbaspirillum sp. B39]